MRTNKEINNSAPERYEAPELEIIEVEAEKGFAQSNGNTPLSTPPAPSSKPTRKY
jgi:hypothetical protein